MSTFRFIIVIVISICLDIINCNLYTIEFTKRGERQCIYESLLPSTDLSITFLSPSWPSKNEKKARSNNEKSATHSTTTYTVEILAGKMELLKQQVRVANEDVPVVHVKSIIKLLEGSKVEERKSGDFHFSLCFTASSRYGQGGIAAFHINEKTTVDPTVPVLKKFHVSGLQQYLDTSHGVGQSIIKEMEYLKRREVRMHQTSESTNRRIMWFSCLSIVVVLACSGGQLWWLKAWFKSKKLL